MRQMFLLSASVLSGVLGLAGAAPAALIYGVTTQNNLIRFDSATPGTLQSGLFISGLQSNEIILDIDFRAASPGGLYGVGSSGRMYTINTATGAATQVLPNLITVDGVEFDIDFNPTVDRMRFVSDTDHSLRLNPGDASTTVDTDMAYVMADSGFGINPNMVGAAYTNNFAGATVTTLFGIDSGRDVLVRIGGVDGSPSPNAGGLTTIGSLGVDTSALVGFDIQGGSGTAFAALSTPNAVNLATSKLYTINLATGAATSLGEIGGGLNVRGLAVQAVPEPTSFALIAVAAAALGSRRRRLRTV